MQDSFIECGEESILKFLSIPSVYITLLWLVGGFLTAFAYTEESQYDAVFSIMERAEKTNMDSETTQKVVDYYIQKENDHLLPLSVARGIKVSGIVLLFVGCLCFVVVVFLE